MPQYAESGRMVTSLPHCARVWTELSESAEKDRKSIIDGFARKKDSLPVYSGVLTELSSIMTKSSTQKEHY